MNIQFFESGGNLLKLDQEETLSSNTSSASGNEPTPLPSKGQRFEIRIKGQLSGIWADWFEGLTVRDLDNGEMLLCGCIVDQSALMGILNKLVRLNLTLISLNETQNQKEKK
jgi:hypothetical protein